MGVQKGKKITLNVAFPKEDEYRKYLGHAVLALYLLCSCAENLQFWQLSQTLQYVHFHFQPV